MKSLCSPGTSIALAFTAPAAPAFGPRTFERDCRNGGLSSITQPESSRSNSNRSANVPPYCADLVSAELTAPTQIQDPLPLWKRGIDLAGCLVALPLLGLCTVFMILLTRCVAPGPIIYWQERIGYRGQRFRIYKFRTMSVGSDNAVHHTHTQSLIETNAPMVKLDQRGDARLIPTAWLLRASGLDELPQIINVLRGEMSLVGPRPCLPTEWQHYGPGQDQRCDRLPGLTGLWQVSGKNRTTFERMIQLDLHYVRRLSFWLDLKIILLTVPSLLTQIYETCQARMSKPKQSQEIITIAPFRGPSDRSSS